MNYQITVASKADAPFIALTVMEAVGNDLCVELAGGTDKLLNVTNLFTWLAANENAQYSYRNTFVARDEAGNALGAIVIYDGERLRPMRHEFVIAANKFLGWNITDEDMAKWGDETGPEQIYIDSLYVRPQYRGTGIASALIEHAIRKTAPTGKPVGLLVEPENLKARRLYEKLGFKKVGINNFFSVPMNHLVRHRDKSRL